MSASRRSILVALAALVVLVLAVLLLVVDDDEAVGVGEAVVVGSGDELADAAEAIDGPVYWVGEREGLEYELSAWESGAVYVRYVEGDADGDDAEVLTVGTYPDQGGVEALRASARQGERSELTRSEDRGFVLIDAGAPDSAYLAYPGARHQVEVYSPEQGHARRLATGGDVQQLP